MDLHRNVLAAVAAVAIAGSASAAVYTGSCTSPPGTSMAVSGQTNGWPESMSFAWTVSDQQPGAPAGYGWYYQYTVSVAKFAPRRLIVETDSLFTATDLTGVQLVHNGTQETYLASNVTVGTQTAALNPSLPSSVYGILFDQIGTGSGNNESIQLSFWSKAAPGWGDFYARCDGNGNRAYNLGFAAADTDPTNAAASGSVLNHALTPQLATQPIPEPGTTAMLGTASLMGLACRRRA